MASFDEQDKNRAEWENPENWGGTRLIPVYFSKRDSRLFVPNRHLFGWVMNYAKPAAMYILMVAYLAGVLVPATVLILAARAQAQKRAAPRPPAQQPARGQNAAGR
jgi:uncharacterized membrane protein